MKPRKNKASISPIENPEEFTFEQLWIHHLLKKYSLTQLEFSAISEINPHTMTAYMQHRNARGYLPMPANLPETLENKLMGYFRK